MKEVTYKEVPDWPMYRVGSDGSVWSKQLRGHRGMEGAWRELHPVAGTNGYSSATLCRGSYKQRISVHRLVLCAFTGMGAPGTESRHLDGNRLNNSIENLQWGSLLENANDKRRHGTTLAGQKNPRAKLTEVEVCLIRFLASQGNRVRSLQEQFCVSKATIKRIVAGKSWKHVSYSSVVTDTMSPMEGL